MLKKLIRLNWDDILTAALIPTGVFLVTQLITAVIMVLVKGGPELEGLSLCGTLLPCISAFATVIVSLGHVGLSFELALKFGCTRRRALFLTLGTIAADALVAFGLSAVLALLDRHAMPWLWAAIRGVDGPLPTEVFALPLWAYPALMLGGIAVGILFGALIQRFGKTGSRILFGVYMAAIIVPQILPDGLFDHSPAMLFPFLGMIAAALLLAGFGWALWSLLHASVRA